MERKALLVVSFGTSYHDAMEKNISAVEREIAAALPDRTLFRAFTSGMILQKLARRDGMIIDDVPAALERIASEGYTDVIVQPTHIMNGDEFEKLSAQADPWRARFQYLYIGAPLLTAVQDYQDVAAALIEEVAPPEEDEALVLMGHGTGHFANAAYGMLEYVLHDAGWKRTFLGTVEGYPTLDEVLRRLREYPGIKQVRLAPFMLVAGDHAHNDMAGSDPESWKSRLEDAGYAVTCNVRGLGEYPGIRQIFARHAGAADIPAVPA